MAQIDKNALLAFCRNEGRRLTGGRKAIVDVLVSSHDHPDAAEIHRRAQKADPALSLSTVYRTLKAFSVAGLIEQHLFEGKRARVEPAPTRHHDHLVDMDDGRVIEFRSDDIERLQAEIAHSLGYELVGHRLELYGRKLKHG